MSENAKHRTKFYYEQYEYKFGSQGTNFFEFTPYRDHYITVHKADAARPLLYWQFMHDNKIPLSL